METNRTECAQSNPTPDEMTAAVREWVDRMILDLEKRHPGAWRHTVTVTSEHDRRFATPHRQTEIRVVWFTGSQEGGEYVMWSGTGDSYEAACEAVTPHHYQPPKPIEVQA